MRKNLILFLLICKMFGRVPGNQSRSKPSTINKKKVEENTGQLGVGDQIVEDSGVVDAGDIPEETGVQEDLMEFTESDSDSDDKDDDDIDYNNDVLKQEEDFDSMKAPEEVQEESSNIDKEDKLRLKSERLEQMRQEQERLELQRQEQDRLQQLKMEEMKQEHERQQRERLELEKQELNRLEEQKHRQQILE